MKLEPITRAPLAVAPFDAAYFDGHYYKVFNENVSWSVARDKCEEMEGYLARIESPEENEFVFRLVRRSAVTREGVILDGGDEVKDDEWRFSDGAPMTYFNWDKNEPDNFGGRYQFVHMRISNGRWFDWPKANMCPFVCEWDQSNGQ